MRTHFCPAEKTLVAFEGECSWCALPEHPSTPVTDKPVTGHAPQWCLDMKSAPTGRKLMALNSGGVAVFASLTPSTLKHFVAWCPLPRLTPEQKLQLHPRREPEEK